MPTATDTIETVSPAGAPPAPKELLNHGAQSAAPIDGWRSVLFGMPFLAAGIAIELVALGVLRPVKHAPDWLIGLLGGLFGSAGLFLIVHGFQSLLRRRSWQRESSQRPNTPWVYDYHWRQEGIAFSAFGEFVKRLIAALVWSLFLAPFAWIGVTVKDGWIFAVVFVIFGLAGFLFWYRAAVMLMDLLKYGNSFLAFSSFPFFLGGSLHARLRVSRHLSTIDELQVTLRCVQEKYVTRGIGRNRSTSVVCYELYGESITIHRDQLATSGSREIPVEFTLPEGAQSTSLAQTPPTYWEIEARGKSHGADYEAVFLVPVYKAS